MTRPSLRVVLFLCTFAASPAAAPPAGAQPLPPQLPPSIRVSDALRETIALMLEKSETFRRQCARIAAAKTLRVTVLIVAPQVAAPTRRAHATIRRYSLGAIRADVALPATADHVELLPHELEHVIEQIEGVDLPAMARAGRGGVVESTDGMYETTRARDAGRAVLREVYGEALPRFGAAARGIGWALRAIGGRAARGTAVRAARPGR